MGGMEETVDGGCSDHVVTDGCGPMGEKAGLEVAMIEPCVVGGDGLEEQVRGVSLERGVTDLVDDQHPIAAQTCEFHLEGAGVVGRQ